MNHAATSTGHKISTAGTSKLSFARHYGEMVLVMVLGMVALGGLGEMALGAVGSSLGDQSGAFRVSFMGLVMTAPMVAWMAYRGHTVAQNVEMAASMIVPSLLAAALAAAGILHAVEALTIQHVVMLPAMLGVMLWRYEEYAHVH